MDNRIFNVNGNLRDKDLLLAALKLAFAQAGYTNPAKAVGYRVCPVKGFVLYRSDSINCVKFPSSLSAEQVCPVILAWFDSHPACEAVGWDADADHDGDNSAGWRIYCDDWGHIGDDHNAFIAIKPAFMWYGK